MRAHLQDVLDAFRHKYTSRSSREPVALSQLVSSIYDEIMTHFDHRLDGRSYRSTYQGRNPYPGEIVSEIDIAGEMWCFFPTHFFKFYQTLVETALPSRADDLARSVFGCGRLTILDVGAGVGTASLAVIDLLHEWQRFLLSSGHAPACIDVNLLTVEMNPLKLPVLDRVLTAATQRVSPYLLRVRALAPIKATYPEEACIRQIHEALAPGGPRLLATFSNILKWMPDRKPSFRALLQWGYEWIKAYFVEPDVPEYLLQTIVLFNQLRFDMKTAVFVETDDRVGRLSSKISQAVETLAARLQDTTMQAADSGRVTFTNPPRSKWYEQGNTGSYRVFYHRGICKAHSPWFRDQRSLHEALSTETLRLAWAKARHWEHTMFISDEVATKLFEASLQWKLERFRQMAYSGSIQQVYSPWTLRYYSPKSPESERPMSVCPLEDQILLIALSWVQQRLFEDSFDSHGMTSFGNRLSDQPDEFLYQHWFRCHGRFVGAVLTALRLWRGGYHQGDISKFFDSLHQGRLADRLDANIPQREEAVRTMWRSHVLTECWSGTGSGRGVLQGHAMSGFLANAYLHPFDKEVCTELAFSERYFRYVDDMIWAYGQDQRPEALPANIVARLSLNHELTLNPEKVASGTSEDYLHRVQDESLQVLAERTHAVIRPVYRLGYRAFHLFRSDKQVFCTRYSQLLQRVGVFISPWYLVRKLRTQGTFGERLRRLLQLGKRLALPLFPEMTESESPTAWAKDFEAMNTRWCKRRRRLADELLTFCRGALLALESKKADPIQKRALVRRIRFAAFRLGVFSHPEARSLFRQLLHLPWVVPPHITTRALRYYQDADTLLEGLTNPSGLVRAKCAQELGHLKEVRARSTLWKMAAQEGRTDIERLAATESLLRIGTVSPDEQSTLLQCIDTENHPYVLKNFLLLLPRAGVDHWEGVAERTVLRCPHQVVVDSFSWIKTRPSDDLFAVPDVEPPYTCKTTYPDLESYPEYFGFSG